MFYLSSLNNLDISKLKFKKATRVFESYFNSICSFFTFVLIARGFSSEAIALYAVIVTASQFIVAFQNSYISYPIINGESGEVRPIVLTLISIQGLLLLFVFFLIRVLYTDINDAINPASILFLLYAFAFYEAIRKLYFNDDGNVIIYWTVILRFIPLLLLFIFKPKSLDEFVVFLAIPILIAHVNIVYKNRNIFHKANSNDLIKHLQKHRLLLISSVLETLPAFILLLVMQESLSALFIGEFRKIQSIYGLLGPFFGYLLLSKISSKSDLSIGKRQSLFIILAMVVVISILYPFVHAILYKESFEYLSLLPFFIVSYLFQGIASNQRATLISIGNYWGLTYVALAVVCYVTLVLLSIPTSADINLFGLVWSLVSVIYFIGYWKSGKVK